ncbi:MAG: hypothetical protein KDD41_06660 [Flavobacteriales bacterium]|nr:hypothetical protein [Flavobacteriales bacterium]
MKKLLTILMLLIAATAMQGQSVEVSSSIDTNYLLFGEQTQIHLKVRYQLAGKTVNLKFPQIIDTLSEFVEVIHTSPIDTSYPDKDDLTLVEQTQSITITSFDSGYYKLPPFLFMVEDDTLSTTEELFIDVQPVAVDTTKAIFDIKKPIEEPFSMIDWLKENWIWIVAILIVLIVIFVLIRYLKNRPQVVVEEAAPEIPIHVLALQRLEELREQKLWQSGKVKTYHSELSEILRSYLEDRYAMHALENTTDEIMQFLRFQPIQPDILVKLQQTLTLADLVKFAKEQPLAAENELSMLNAMEFINQTKLIVTAPEKHAE